MLLRSDFLQTYANNAGAAATRSTCRPLLQSAIFNALWGLRGAAAAVSAALPS